jgi:hypothetical protein
MLIIKIYAFIFLADVILISLYIYTGKRRQRREIRQMLNSIFKNQKTETV